jgi:hypothetical protein
MAIAILIAQIVKIGAGLAQLALACWILVHRPSAAAKTAFGISIGANGIAYAIFNLALPGNRTQGSLALEGRAIFNWVAAVAMLAFAALFIRSRDRRKGTLLAAIPVAGLALAGAILGAARYHLTVLEFGGASIYAATAFVLGALPIAPAIRADRDRTPGWCRASRLRNAREGRLGQYAAN